MNLKKIPFFNSPPLLYNEIRHGVVLQILCNNLTAGLHCRCSQEGIVYINAMTGMPLTVDCSSYV
jgi:hypothetical protein